MFTVPADREVSIAAAGLPGLRSSFGLATQAMCIVRAILSVFTVEFAVSPLRRLAIEQFRRNVFQPKVCPKSSNSGVASEITNPNNKSR